MVSIVRRWLPGCSVFAAIGCALIAAGCAGTADVRIVAATHLHAPAVRATAASCAGLTPAEQFAAAKVVFDGIMSDGATAPLAGAVLASPARVRVERYVKGTGPRVVTVQTAMTIAGPGAVRVDEDGIRPRAGERWRIYASSPGQPYATSICLGSRKLPFPTRRPG